MVDEFTFKTKSQTLSNKTFVAPVLGSATATSINGLTITPTAGTLTIPNNASAALVLSGNFSTTLTSTGATSVTLPTTGTLVSTDQTVGQTIGTTGARLTKLWATDVTATGFTGPLTGDVTGHSSLDLPLTGGTLTGNLLFSLDNTLDIGASGATRPRTIYLGTSVIAPVGTFATSVSTPSLITASGALGITPASGSNLNINLGTTGDLAVNTSQLYVDTSLGNIGIGTTGPAFKLSVQTAGDVYGLAIGDVGSANGARLKLGYALASDYGFIQAINDGSAYKSLSLNPSGGNVGIGTTGPYVKLDVRGAIQAGTVPSADLGYGIATYDSGNRALFYSRDSSGAGGKSWVFGNSGTDFKIQDATDSATPYMTILSSGNVGIGTTAPGEKLEVVGNIISKGTSWTARAAGEADYWRSVTYGNGLFVAVASVGTNKVMTSPDGINWTARAAAEANPWRSVTYGNGLFVAVASTGTNQVMTSSDGITWTARSAEASNWRSVTYGSGLFVAVSTDGTNQIMTSPDGITWTPIAATEANIWSGVTYGNGLFVAVAESGTNRVMTSPNGTTWTARSATEASNWQSVTYGNGLFVAISYTGTNRIMTSPDGITWTARSATEANSWYGITYGNGTFVAVSLDGTNQVMTSGKSEMNVITTKNIYQGGMGIQGNVGIGTTSPTGNLSVTQTIAATGALKGIVYTGAVNTNQTLSTEIPSLTITTAGRQWATGALTTQREILITQPTYSFVGASTITDAATVGIAGAPIKSSNATITNTHALLIQAGAVSTAVNSYGLTVNTQTGATNNYAAAFLGGNVGIGTTAPAYQLQNQGSFGLNQGTPANNFIGGNLDFNRTDALSYMGTTNNFAFGFLTNNTEKMRISATGGLSLGSGYVATDPGAGNVIISGNVGIGTTGPSARLEVNTSVTGPQLVLANDSTGAATNIGLRFNSNNSASAGARNWGIVTNNTVYGDLNFMQSNAVAGDPIAAGTSRLYIKNDGYVGIGTTAPGALLDIAPSRGTWGITLRDTDGSNSGGLYLDGSGNGDLGLNDNTGTLKTWLSSNDVSYFNAGNVGIGTVSPTANLQVAQGTAGVGTVSVGAGGTAWTGVGTQFLNTFKVGDTITSEGQTLTIATITSDTALTTNAVGAAISAKAYTLVGGTRFSVMGNGSVGIGTTNNSYVKLAVKGTAQAPANPGTEFSQGIFRVTSGVDSLDIGILPSGNYATWIQAGYGTYTSPLAINPNGGNVGIGTTGPSFPLSFGTSVGNKIALYDAGSGSGYGFGIQSSLLQIFANSVTDRVGIGYGNSGAFTETLTVKGANVGIGAPAPGVKLEVVSADNIISYFNGSAADYARVNINTPANSDAQLSFMEGGGTKWTVGNDGSDSDKLKFMPTFGAFDGSSEVLTIQSNGSVGIGTASPTNLLSLGGTAARTIWMERNTTAATAGQGLTLSSGGAIAGTADLAGGDLTLKSGISTGTGTSALHFYTATAGTTGTADNTPTEKMTILGSGSVGIGTTAPAAKLDVWDSKNLTNLKSGTIITDNSAVGLGVGGNILFKGKYNAGSYMEAAGIDAYKETASSGEYDFALRFLTRTDFGDPGYVQERMRITSSGNVGIGTTAPGALLQVGSSTQIASGSVTSIYGTFTTTLNVGYDTSGTTATFKSLSSGANDVAGVYNLATAANNNAAGVAFYANRTGTADTKIASIQGMITDITAGAYKGALLFNTSNNAVPAERMRIGNTGLVGIGTTAPGTMLTVGTVTTNTGDITVYGTGTTCTIGNGTGATNCTSDVRLKDNVTTLGSELQNIMALRPISFNWKDPNRSQTTNTGLIAQEVQTIYPNLVHVVYDDYLGIDYAALVVPAIKAIQEMNLNLDAVVGTITPLPGSPSESFAISFFNNLFAKITTWLADATNGIGNVFANVFNAKEKICVDGECLTKDDIKALLLLAHPNGSPSLGSGSGDIVNNTPTSENVGAGQTGSGTPAPALEPAAPAPDPASPVSEIIPTPEIIPPPAEPVPAPTPTPAPEPTPEPLPDSTLSAQAVPSIQ